MLSGFGDDDTDSLPKIFVSSMLADIVREEDVICLVCVVCNRGAATSCILSGMSGV